jgi:hypothetical protein
MRGLEIEIDIENLTFSPTDMKAAPPLAIPPIPSNIPWGIPYVPGSPTPTRSRFPSGKYVLKGEKSGFAQVEIAISNSTTTTTISVSANYTSYSDDGYHVIDGEESAIRNQSSPIIIELFWRSSLTLSGCERGTKVTSPDGYRVVLDLWNPVVESTGTLSTTLGNTTYTSPNPGT